MLRQLQADVVPHPQLGVIGKGGNGSVLPKDQVAEQRREAQALLHGLKLGEQLLDAPGVGVAVGVPVEVVLAGGVRHGELVPVLHAHVVPIGALGEGVPQALQGGGSLLLGDGLGLLIVGDGKVHSPLGALLWDALHSGGSLRKRRLLPQRRLGHACLCLAFLLPLGAFHRGGLLDRGGAAPCAQLHHPQRQGGRQQQADRPHQRGDVPTPVGPAMAGMDHRPFGTP